MLIRVDRDIHEHQPILHGEGLLHGALQLRRIAHRDADVAIGFRQLDEVRQGFHVGVAVTAAVEHLLPLLDHAQRAVVDGDDLDGHPVLHAGGELLDVHLHRAVAGDAADHGIRVGKLGPHGGRNAKAHGAEAPGVDPLARLGKRIVEGGEHLVLTHVGGDEGLPLGHLVERLYHLLRLDQGGVGLVGQAVAGAPLIDLAPPVRQRLLVVVEAALADHFQHLLQHGFHRADDGHMGLYRLGDGGGVYVDVDYGGVGAELAHVVGDAVIEAGTHGEDEIRVVHALVRFEGAMHPQHADELRMGAAEGPQSHQGGGHRQVQQLCQLGHQVIRIGVDGATAHVHDGAARLGQQLGGPLDLALVSGLGRIVGAQGNGLGILVGEFLFRVLHVLGQVHHHGPRAATGGNVVGLLDGVGNLAGLLAQEAVLHHRAGDADHVGLLERVLPYHAGRHLTGQDHQGDRVHVGGGDAGDAVGGAGTRGHQHSAHLAGGAGVTVRHVHRGLLVPHQDMLHLAVFEESVIDVEH